MSRHALQLYSIRAIEEPLPALLDRVAAAGYDGVEFANRVHDAAPGAVAEALDDTGLTPVSAHVSLDALERAPEAHLALYDRLGCRDLVIPHLSASWLRSESRIDQVATRLRTLARRLDSRGFRLHYHTQPQDFRPLCPDDLLDRLVTAIRSDQVRIDTVSPGTRARSLVAGIVDRLAREHALLPETACSLDDTAFAHLLAGLDSTVGLQVDVGSVAGAGYDPVTVLDRFAPRSRSLHLADVAADSPGPTADVTGVPAGRGLLDLPAVLGAAERLDVDWLIYENDSPADPRRTIAHGIEIVDDGLSMAGQD
jgi:sugar phosphate isomerase/epimerase